jgi:hypothetical protein
MHFHKFYFWYVTRKLKIIRTISHFDTLPLTTEDKIKLRQESQRPGPLTANQHKPDYYLILSRTEMDACINLIDNLLVSETYLIFFHSQSGSEKHDMCLLYTRQRRKQAETRDMFINV